MYHAYHLPGTTPAHFTHHTTQFHHRTSPPHTSHLLTLHTSHLTPNRHLCVCGSGKLLELQLLVPNAGTVQTLSIEDQQKAAVDELTAAKDDKIKDGHHEPLILKTVHMECTNPGRVYLGRAVDKPHFDSGWRIGTDKDNLPTSQPNSLSFCSSLLAGYTKDDTACTYKISTDKVATYAITIKISDYLSKKDDRANSFYLPPVPTLMSLYGDGEMWHPRSKYCSPDEYKSLVGGIKATPGGGTGAADEKSGDADSYLGDASAIKELRADCKGALIPYAVSIHAHIFG